MKTGKRKSFLGAGSTGRSEARALEPVEGEILSPSDPRNSIGTPTSLQLQAWENQLGIIDKIKKNAMTRKEISKHLGEFYVNAIKAQKDHMLRRLDFWLDERNKEAYTEYQSRIKNLEALMVRQSTEFTDEMVDYCVEYAERFWVKKKERKDHFDRILAAGQISGEDHRRALEMVDEFVDAQVQDLRAKLDAIVTKQQDRLDRTLELFDAQRLTDQ